MSGAMSKARLEAIQYTALAIASNRTARNDPGYLHRQIRRLAEMVAEMATMLENSYSIIVVDSLTAAGEEHYRREIEAIKRKGEENERDLTRPKGSDGGFD